jgi:hypothetical protein
MSKCKVDGPEIGAIVKLLEEHVPELIGSNLGRIADSLNESPDLKTKITIETTVDVSGKAPKAKMIFTAIPIIRKYKDTRELESPDPEQLRFNLVHGGPPEARDIPPVTIQEGDYPPDTNPIPPAEPIPVTPPAEPAPKGKRGRPKKAVKVVEGQAPPAPTDDSAPPAE